MFPDANETDRLRLERFCRETTAVFECYEAFAERSVEAHGGQYDGVLRNWVPMDDHVADLHRYTVSRAEYESAGDAEGR